MVRAALMTAPLAGMTVMTAPAIAEPVIYTGILSPDDASLFCYRANTRFHEFSDGRYGCAASKLKLSCEVSMRCVAVTRPLDPNLGSPIDAWLMQHGLHRVD